MKRKINNRVKEVFAVILMIMQGLISYLECIASYLNEIYINYNKKQFLKNFK